MRWKTCLTVALATACVAGAPVLSTAEAGGKSHHDRGATKTRTGHHIIFVRAPRQAYVAPKRERHDPAAARAAAAKAHAELRALFARVPRTPYVSPPRERYDHAAARAASAKAHAELRALFAPVPRQPYVAPKRERTVIVRRKSDRESMMAMLFGSHKRADKRSSHSRKH